MSLQLTSLVPEQTSQYADALAASLRAGDCLVLTGDLGAGKTWFSTSLFRALAVRDAVHSPTFTLVNVYQTVGWPIYHADFYRLDSLEELWAAGWEDYLDGRGLLLIEWGERFPQALPDDYLQITLRVAGPSTRQLSTTASGPRSREIEEAWADALGCR